MIVTTSYETRPQTTKLTTLDRLATQLEIESAAREEALEELIVAASRAVESHLGWEVSRAEVVDRFQGSGMATTTLRRTPIVTLGTVQHNGETVSQADQAIVVMDVQSGIVQRAQGWTWSDRPLWTAQYFGGWLTPDDDFQSNTVTFDEDTTDTITLVGAVWPLVQAGDVVQVVGTASNDGNHVVSARTSDTVLTLEDGTITDEGTGVQAEFRVSTLPADIERAVIIVARDMLAAGGDAASVTGGIKAINTPGLSVAYAEASSTAGSTSIAASPSAVSLLQNWVRWR